MTAHDRKWLIAAIILLGAVALPLLIVGLVIVYCMTTKSGSAI